jgi:hypothetical protein
MGQRLYKLFVIVPLALSLGTPWALLQSVAWVGMLVNYYRQTTLAQAVSMTFDGKHPCRLCQAIQEGKAQEREKKKDGLESAKELKLVLAQGPCLLTHPPMPGVAAAPDTFPPSRREPPPVPPPRLA